MASDQHERSPEASSPPATVRYRILTFRGTKQQLRDYLRACLDNVLERPRDIPGTEEFEWELTASISRHPAGKGLRADG